MKVTSDSVPFYLKASIFFIGLWAFFTILFIAKVILIPLIFSGFIAVMLNPVVNFLHCRLKIPRIISIFIALVMTFIALAGLGLFIYSQLSIFGESWPKLGEKAGQLLDHVIKWITTTFNISEENINTTIVRLRSNIASKTISTVTATLSAMTGILSFLFLMPVYVFLFLFYKSLFIQFILKAAGTENKNHASEIILGTRGIIQSYLNGLVIEAIIVAVLNSIGLLVLGIEYAILLGVMGAILNAVPYIGGLIAVCVTMLIALITKSPIYSFYVLLLYMLVQFIDNQIIFPRIVGSKVQINAMVSIVAVISGGLYWGIAGMFLSLPIVAVLKIIFDRTTTLKPWGEVLGNIMPVKQVHLKKHST